jgi:hypothetical protein
MPPFTAPHPHPGGILPVNPSETRHANALQNPDPSGYPSGPVNHPSEMVQKQSALLFGEFVLIIFRNWDQKVRRCAQ